VVLAEAVALRQKLSRDRIHPGGLRLTGRIIRHCAERCCIAFFGLIQPVIASLLVTPALDKFTPGFSVHVMAALHQRLQHGNLNDSRTLRHPPD